MVHQQENAHTACLSLGTDDCGLDVVGLTGSHEDLIEARVPLHSHHTANSANAPHQLLPAFKSSSLMHGLHDKACCTERLGQNSSDQTQYKMET